MRTYWLYIRLPAHGTPSRLSIIHPVNMCGSVKDNNVFSGPPAHGRLFTKGRDGTYAKLTLQIRLNAVGTNFPNLQG